MNQQIDTREDCFLNYQALTSKIKSLAKKHGDYLNLDSIGQSHEGREIWVLELTNQATGPADDKPALLLDGNIHAVEVTASSAAIYHVETMIAGAEQDEEIRRCLDTRAFYVIPRVCPDGAELALASRPRFIRSATRPYFHSDKPQSRMVTEDIDGDGRILAMRLRDENGRWKKHPDDPRVMVQREPTEEGGEYYRLFAEGSVEDAEAEEIPPVRPREGVDLNRNWPSDWAAEFVQQGAGRYSLSEPETQALAKFISEHPNIFTWIAGHTFSGVLLRPGFAEPDSAMPPADLEHYKAVGRRGTELSQYPALDGHSGFQINPGDIIHGSMEWGYKNFGIYTWVIEYWGPHQLAGVEIENFARWFFDHPGEDDLKMVRWGDEVLGDAGFVDWYEYEHPALGKVELGGWDVIRTLYNPPADMLAEVIQPFPKWFTWQLLMSPLLRFRSLDAEKIAQYTWKIRAVIENQGYLPTHCSVQALKTKAVRGVDVRLQCGKGVELMQGKNTQNSGELGGRAFRHSSALLPNMSDQSDDRVSLEWVVRAEEGRVVSVSASHDRAGKVRKLLTLGSAGTP